jgi:hypothetical protein
MHRDASIREHGDAARERVLAGSAPLSSQRSNEPTVRGKLTHNRLPFIHDPDRPVAIARYGADVNELELRARGRRRTNSSVEDQAAFTAVDRRAKPSHDRIGLLAARYQRDSEQERD